MHWWNRPSIKSLNGSTKLEAKKKKSFCVEASVDSIILSFAWVHSCGIDYFWIWLISVVTSTQALPTLFSSRAMFALSIPTVMLSSHISAKRRKKKAHRHEMPALLCPCPAHLNDKWVLSRVTKYAQHDCAYFVNSRRQKWEPRDTDLLRLNAKFFSYSRIS